MTSQPVTGNTTVLTFRRVTGEPGRALVAVDGTESRVGDFLIARWIWLDDRTELRQLRVAPGQERSVSYERLDNEILAGRRLHDVTEDVGYPPVLSHLYGDEAESSDPYALLEPYQGEPLQAVVGRMIPAEQRAFELSLLTGLCWLEVAGIAHRGLSPSTVRWHDGRRHVQITDFSLSTVFGVPREATGPDDWVGPEQRPGRKVSGLVTERDDMHAVGRLIYYVRSHGAKVQSRDQLAGDAFADLRPLFGAPDSRPTARELLRERRDAGDLIPAVIGSDAHLSGGYERFDSLRHEKHPGVVRPENRHNAGSDAAGAPGGMTAPQMSPESAPTGPVVPEAVAPPEPADQDKRWFRWGGRS
jgi:serine/threonine protein kinase